MTGEQTDREKRMALPKYMLIQYDKINLKPEWIIRYYNLKDSYFGSSLIIVKNYDKVLLEYQLN